MNRQKNLKDINFVAFDLETTGLFPVTSKIIEIGAVKFNLDGEISRFETLIDPESHISQDSFEVHGITYEMVKGKPKIKTILPEFIEFMEDSVLIAHNAIFDVSFIAYALLRENISIPTNLVLDTRILAKSLIEDSPNYKLKTLTEYFGFDGNTYHRALCDAEYCMKVFLKIIERTFPENTNFEQLIKYNKPIAFNIVSEENNKLDIPDMYLPIKEAIQKNIRLKITYKKVDGEISDRDITPLNFLRLKNKLYVEAFCHLRNEKRNFKLSKIIKVTNIATAIT